MSNENSRDEILNTACKLFSQNGYDAVGVQEICEKSGITKPTLYYYFGSKKGLLQALIETKGHQLLQELKTAATYNHNFPQSLKELLVAQINFAKTNPEYFHLHLNLINAPENSESAQCFAQLKAQLNSLILDFFVQSTQEIGNMKGKEQLYSTLFHNNLITITASVLSGMIDDNEDSLHKIIHSFMYGVVN